MTTWMNPNGNRQITPQQPGVAKVTNPAQPVVQRPPAPGQSPQGGTTSLPQHLQSPNRAGASPTDGAATRGGGKLPGAPGTTMPGAPAPAAPVPANIPPGAVPPPPPPPAAPAPAGPPGAPAAEGAAEPRKQMGDTLFQKLMEMLTKPQAAFDGSKEAEGMRSQGYAKLDDERRLAEDRAKADAAKRGVFYGSPLTNSLGDIGERYLRGGADLETNIQRDMGRRGQEFQQQQQENQRRAIETIFGYGDRQRMDQKQQDDLWLKLLELGYVGGPQMPNNGGIPMVGGV